MDRSVDLLDHLFNDLSFNFAWAVYILRRKMEWPNMHPSRHLTCILRKPILDLFERFECGGGWGLERTLNGWISRQPWRQPMPLTFFELLPSKYNTVLVFVCFWLCTCCARDSIFPHFLFEAELNIQSGSMCL